MWQLPLARLKAAIALAVHRTKRDAAGAASPRLVVEKASAEAKGRRDQFAKECHARPVTYPRHLAKRMTDHHPSGEQLMQWRAALMGN